jgi:hypothetical protein
MLFSTITSCKIGCVDGALYVITKTRIKDMKKTEAKLSLADVKVVYPKSVVKQIVAKYSFDFEFDGTGYRCWHDAKGNVQFTFPEEVGPQMIALIEEIDGRIHNMDAAAEDVRKFLSKYMLMNVMIGEELQQIPRSKLRYEAANVKPLDMDSLSVEEQCALEVLKEQTEKAHALAAADGGKFEDGVEVTVTKDMVKAKLAEKMRQKK